MKRNTIVKMLAAEIVDSHDGQYSNSDLQRASNALRLLEEFGIVKPKHKVSITRLDIEAMPYEDFVEVSGWEKE